MSEMNELSRRSESARNARLEAERIQRNNPRFAERASALCKIVTDTDFLEMGKNGSLDDADLLEKQAFIMLEKLEKVGIDISERSQIEMLFMRVYCIRLRKRFEESLANKRTPRQALDSLIGSIDSWGQGAGNIPELRETLARLRESLVLKYRFGTEWDHVQQSIHHVAGGEGSAEEEDFVGRFYRAVQGIYSRGRSHEKEVVDYYKLTDHEKLVVKFARSYGRMARRKIRQGEFDPYIEEEGAYGIDINYPKAPRPRRSNDELE